MSGPWFPALRRVEWGAHGAMLVFGAFVVVFATAAVAVALCFGIVAYKLFPWDLLAVPLLALFYAVGRLV